MGGIAIGKFTELKLKMDSVLVSNSKEYKKVKGVSKNIVAKISRNEYKNVSSNKKCLRHSMIRIQKKHYRIETYENSKTYLSCFDDKVYILDNGIDALALGA